MENVSHRTATITLERGTSVSAPLLRSVGEAMNGVQDALDIDSVHLDVSGAAPADLMAAALSEA